MILRLVESDLYNLISSTVKKIIKESLENNELLSRIVERLSTVEVPSNTGENYIDVPLDDEGNVVACIDYELNDNRHLMRGRRDFEVNDPDEIGGDFEVYITSIVIDDNGQQMEVSDNGMVTNALKSLINPDESDLTYYDDMNDDQSGYNDSWA